MTLYIKNAVYIDWESLFFKNTDIMVEKGAKGKIEFFDAIPPEKDLQVLDAKGRFVTKSFGCGHHHIYSTLARGMPAPAKNPENFLEILKYIWWNLDKNLDLEMIKASALASAVYCAKNGVTFVIDHHSSPLCIQGSLQTIKHAFDQIGISHLLCYECSDRNGHKISEQGLAETKNYLSQQGNQGHVGLHASFTVKDDLLGKAVELAGRYNTGIHIHTAEDMADEKACLKDYGKRVIHRLKDAGVLDLPKTILSHCIHLDKSEAKLLKASKVWVAQNIESNLNNRVGIADYSQYGSNIILGTDGMHSDMLRSAKQAFFSGQQKEKIDFLQIYKRFRNIHNYIEASGFSGDSDNNLIVLDYNSPTEMTKENFLGHFIYGIDSIHVNDVISSGSLIVKDKKLISSDEDEILTFARQMGRRLWKKLK